MRPSREMSHRSHSTILREIQEAERRYGGHRGGTVALVDEAVEAIKCPRSFKVDSFCDIPTGL